jgi:hypothetical protein
VERGFYQVGKDEGRAGRVEIETIITLYMAIIPYS